MDKATVRLELLKILLPQSSRVGITTPEHTIDICKKFEDYVLLNSEEVPASQASGKPGRPAKTTDNKVPAFLDPAQADKSISTGQT
jgi:hypothetical protein